MQQVAELDAQANRVDLRASRKRKASPRRKVTVRLSEGVCGRLDVAADRPGVAKSLLVEVALEHFLNPVPSVEALVRDRLDDIHARFDQLERDMRMIAEHQVNIAFGESAIEFFTLPRVQGELHLGAEMHG